MAESRPQAAAGASESQPPAIGRRIRGLDATERQAQRRRQLLDAALELFASRGYPNTSIEQICQVAYVGTKSFYELFDGREACYIALLQEITEQIMAGMVERFREAPGDATEGSRMLVAAFAHELVDDPRVAKVTFGEGGAISPAVERQRRANRRRAASFLESIWRRYDVTTDPQLQRPGRRSVDLHRVAVGAIGGMFELVADWLQDADPGSPADVEALITDLTDFHEAVQSGLGVRRG
jgi:AcrR family transcriptional regulator